MGTRESSLHDTSKGAHDATGTYFILISDQTESNTGWGYNRYIGQAGDNAGNIGTAIPAFSDPIFRDFAQHRIKLVANDLTVRVYLDEVFGLELAFPFSSGLHFALMAGARAEQDNVVAAFDNVSISGTASLTPAQLSAVIQNGNLVISWTGYGVLQEAESLGGPWTDITAAFSPYTVPGGTVAPMIFYRVRQ